MEIVELKYQCIHELAVAPYKKHETDAGYDLTCVAITKTRFYDIYHTGLKILIPKGYFGLLPQRSSISSKNQILSNCIGIDDSGYTGEITFRFRRFPISWIDRIFRRASYYQVGDRIGQLVVLKLPYTRLIEVNKMPETDRGEGGYGSTGK